MNRRAAIFLAIITSLLLAVFFLFPAWMVLKQAFEGHRADGTAFFTLEFLGMVLRDPIYQEGLINALMLGVASTVASLLIAMPLALVSQRFEYPGKSVLGVLVLAPLILPPFVGAVGIKQILGSQGALNALLVRLAAMDAQLPYDWLAHGRFGGIIAMNALHLYPILYLNIAAALAKLDPALEQAAHNLGCAPWKRFWRITLPLTMPGVFAGAAIVFIWAFTELGVPLVFDYARVAPVQIFDGIKGLDKNPLPYALSAILLLIAMVVFGLSKWTVGSTRLGAAPRPQGRSGVLRCGRWQAAACTALFTGISALALLPHLGVVLLSVARRWYGTILPEQLTLHHYLEALGNGLVVPSIHNSLLYAGTATLLAMGCGLAVAWVVVRSDLRCRGWLDALVMLPLAVPGLVMAFGYLALSQEGKALHFLIGTGGSPFMLLAIAYAIRRLPYVVRAAVAGLQQSNPALEEAARTLGASPARVLRRIALPLIAGNLAAGAILAFAFAMLEVSDSLILAQQAQHFPITKALYSLLGSLGNGTELAAALGVWSMAFLATSILAAGVLGGKRGALFKL
ncbi:MAG: iron ABC transporter permease [Verrucomicrobiota bacterium]